MSALGVLHIRLARPSDALLFEPAIHAPLRFLAEVEREKQMNAALENAK